MRSGTTTLQTQPGLMLGTARYMSPEQTRGQTVDARSDIWSLGVVLYEMVGGIPPFAGETPSDCIASILTTEPPPLSDVLPDVPVKLQSIVQKALRKNSDERYQTIKEMLADLHSSKRLASPLQSGWKRQKKITALLAASIAVALVIAGLFIYVRPTRTVTNTLAGNAMPLVSVIPEKSVAVIPFENLSADQESARFADGMQDEILTDLAKIADLKVIGPHVVMQYKSGIARNLREIAQQLGVAHLLEGSVQRGRQSGAGEREADRCAQSTRICGRRPMIATWLMSLPFKVRLPKPSPINCKPSSRQTRRMRLNRRPTTDLAAFDLYTRAKTLILTSAFSATGEQNLRQAVELLNQAVKRDPVLFRGLLPAGLLLTTHFIRFGLRSH